MLSAATTLPASRIAAPTAEMPIVSSSRSYATPLALTPFEVGEQFGTVGDRVGRLRRQTFGQQPLYLLVAQTGEQRLPDRGAVRR